MSWGAQNVFPLSTNDPQPAEDECMTQEGEFPGVDLSRLPPKAFLKSVGARNAIRKELYGLLHVDSLGSAPVTVVSLFPPAVRRIPKYATTMIVRVEQGGIIKARMCLRGDQVDEARHHFTSAPTVGRNFVKMLLVISRMFSFSAASIDVTQAFLQSTRLADSDRYIAILPSYVALDDLTWNGRILDHFPLD